MADGISGRKIIASKDEKWHGIACALLRATTSTLRWRHSIAFAFICCDGALVRQRACRRNTAIAPARCRSYTTHASIGITLRFTRHCLCAQRQHRLYLRVAALTALPHARFRAAIGAPRGCLRQHIKMLLLARLATNVNAYLCITHHLNWVLNAAGGVRHHSNGARSRLAPHRFVTALRTCTRHLCAFDLCHSLRILLWWIGLVLHKRLAFAPPL